MIFGANFRRQAHVLALRLSEDCDDQHLAERLKARAADPIFEGQREPEERQTKGAASESSLLQMKGPAIGVHCAGVIPSAPNSEGLDFQQAQGGRKIGRDVFLACIAARSWMAWRLEEILAKRLFWFYWALDFAKIFQELQNLGFGFEWPVSVV